MSSRRIVKSKVGSLPPAHSKTNQLINVITEQNKYGLGLKNRQTKQIMVEKHSDANELNRLNGMEYSYSARPSTLINNVKRSLSR
jgi:hypothetical protein